MSQGLASVIANAAASVAGQPPLLGETAGGRGADRSRSGVSVETQRRRNVTHEVPVAI